MHWFAAPDYWLARVAFQRGLGALYVVAYLAAAWQFRALLGSRGLLPIPRFVDRVPFRRFPSLFHLHYSDRFFAAVAWSGAALAVAMVAGLGDIVPLWAAMALWAALWALYLSIVNVGQAWYGFGWESLLLETGFLAIFLGNADVGPPALILWLLWWLLFRVEFGAGLIKLRGDPCWRDLTCLRYHHETQPMPGPLSWYFHHLPDRLHRIEVLGNYVAQLAAPVLVFAPQPVASVAAAVIVITQLWLVTSGNFAWLNWLTIVLGLSVVDTGSLGHLVELPSAPTFGDAPYWFIGLVVAATALVLVLSYRPARNLFSSKQVMNSSFDSLHLVNTYGAFGRVTRVRDEIAIEGTTDPEPGEDTLWHEYQFKGKPGDPRRLPPQVAPYHLRLDWMMWFAALSPAFAEPWMSPFVAKLLVNDHDTLKLLRTNPFPDAPPVWIRARLYRYRFTTRQERKAGEGWWHRTLTGEFIRPVSLPDRDTSGQPG
jgi:hypothetical protein